MKKLLFALLTIGLFAACSVEEEVIATRTTGADLEVLYELISNNYQNKDQYLNEFVLQNHSKFDLNDKWTIYFHQPLPLIEESIEGPVNVQHINGDY